MDAELGRLVDLKIPKLNPLLANGLAVTHMKLAEDWIEKVLNSASRSFPEGLKFKGLRRCTPETEFHEASKKKGTRRTFDVARSDIYMVELLFTWRDEEIKPSRFIYLPFVSDAGTIVISGSRFTISPILSDRVISVGATNIFVRLLRARVTAERMSYSYMVDGRQETVQVAWSELYHKNAKMKKLRKTVNANATLMHYLLCKEGFSITFLKYGNCRPIVGGAEITYEVYPESEWVICTPLGGHNIRPKGWGRAPYPGTNLRVAVRKSEMTPMVRNMLGGFFYIVDHFPDRVLPEYVESERNWMILMGHIIFSGNIMEGKLADDIKDHIQSLDEYLDSLVISKLHEINVPVTDVYQLFAYIIEKFSDMLLGASDKVASMYDKELSVLYYVLYEFTSAIFKLTFKLKAASKKELSMKDIVSVMNITLRPGLVFSIVKNHGEVSTISSPGDNKAVKITSILVPQSGSSRLSTRKDRVVLNDPSKLLHPSVAEVGSYSALPKSEPSGRSRLNLCLQIDEKGVVIPDPQFVPLLASVGETTKR